MSAIRLNPKLHFPRTKRGRPGEKSYSALRERIFEFGRGRPRTPKYWKLDIYGKNNEFLETLLGQGTKQTAMSEAQGMIGKTYKGNSIIRAELDGPFESLDDIEINESVEEYSTDEKEVMEMAATMQPAPRGTVKWPLREGVGKGAAQPKKRGRPKASKICETCKFKKAQIVQLIGTKNLAIIQSELANNKYKVFVRDESGIHGAILPENRLAALGKGRPSAYIQSIFKELREALVRNI